MTEGEEIWVRVADALWFIDDPEAIAQIADRFETGYGPALRNANTPAARERAEDALWRYLSSGATPRKLWRLSQEDAHKATEALVELADQGDVPL